MLINTNTSLSILAKGDSYICKSLHAGNLPQGLHYCYTYGLLWQLIRPPSCEAQNTCLIRQPHKKRAQYARMVAHVCYSMMKLRLLYLREGNLLIKVVCDACTVL